MSIYTPTAAEDLEELSHLFEVCWHTTVESDEWRDNCAALADMFDRLYSAAVLLEAFPPVWQRAALLVSRDYYARMAEDIDDRRT